MFGPAHYSMSTWRAIHPEGPGSTLRSTHSHAHIHSAEFSCRSQYARSSVSLTRPTRLSSLSSSSRSGSNGLESRDDLFSGGIHRSERATPSEIAHAIKNGTPIPGSERIQGQSRHHLRTASAPTATSGVIQTTHKGFWKELDAKTITRKPVPVRRLRSADRIRISDAFIYAEVAGYTTNSISSDSRNRLESAELVWARRMTFEQVKNKPLPKIAVF